jgi:FkbM family methyltransferase
MIPAGDRSIPGGVRAVHETQKRSDLIYDVGMHHGEDAEFYLRKGFRVVAFEADPDLVAECRQRLGGFLASGALTIVEGAVVDADRTRPAGAHIPFFKNLGLPAWNTTRPEWASRNERLGAPSRVIEVPTVSFEDALRHHGVPRYLKVDIEGDDLACIRVLGRFRERPDYVSLESDKTSFGGIREEVALLASLGYSGFQAVEQSAIGGRAAPAAPPHEGSYVDWTFPPGASGPFGRELGAHWVSRGALLRQYWFIRLGYLLLGDAGVMVPWTFRGASRLKRWTTKAIGAITGATVPGWFDTHARHARAADRADGARHS